MWLNLYTSYHSIQQPFLFTTLKLIILDTQVMSYSSASISFSHNNGDGG